MKRKLKTMAALLAEYPKSSFDAQGDLILRGLNFIEGLSAKYFKELGKEAGDLINLWWVERLLEPLPEIKRRGKLYAYYISIPYPSKLNVFTQAIAFTDHPDQWINTNGFVRNESKDLDLGELDDLKARVEALEAIKRGI